MRSLLLQNDQSASIKPLEIRMSGEQWLAWAGWLSCQTSLMIGSLRISRLIQMNEAALLRLPRLTRRRHEWPIGKEGRGLPRPSQKPKLRHSATSAGRPPSRADRPIASRAARANRATRASTGPCPRWAKRSSVPTLHAYPPPKRGPIYLDSVAFGFIPDNLKKLSRPISMSYPAEITAKYPMRADGVPQDWQETRERWL
jgi:hypothetical protein